MSAGGFAALGSPDLLVVTLTTGSHGRGLMLVASSGWWFGSILFLIVWILIAFWPARVAGRKGHSFFLYFLFSLVFFPAALIVAYMVKDRRAPPRPDWKPGAAASTRRGLDHLRSARGPAEPRRRRVMQAECHGMPTMTGHGVRGRHLAAGLVVTLLAIVVLGALTGTASARMGRSTAGITTSPETTTSAPPTTSDTTTAATEPVTTEITTTETTPAGTTTIELTTTTSGAGLSPGGAAVVGAAAASSDDGSDTQWGWIAFGILAAAVIVFGIVWLVRRSRHASSG